MFSKLKMNLMMKKFSKALKDSENFTNKLFHIKKN